MNKEVLAIHMDESELAVIEALGKCPGNLRETVADLFRLQKRRNATPDELLAIMSGREGPCAWRT